MESQEHGCVTIRYVSKQKPVVCKVTLFIIYLFSFTIKFSNSQNAFPSLTNIAQDRPVHTNPSDSTCGIPTRNAYCISSIYKASVDQCVQNFCVQSCPNRTGLPLPVNLLMGTSDGECIMSDLFNTKPQSNLIEYSTYFMKPGPDCFLTPSTTPEINEEGAYTFTMWIWKEKGNFGTIVEKFSSNTSEVFYQLQIVPTGVSFTYRSNTGVHTVTFTEVIPAKTWTHLALQAYKSVLSFYVNGIGPGYSPTYTVELAGSLLDGDGTIRVGQDHSGGEQFLGRLQDLFIYSTTLSNREIQEVFTRFLPQLRFQSDCRCPVSHPRVRPDKTHYCIPNNVVDNSGDVLLRLNDESHVLDFVNDGDSNSIWISKFQNAVELIIDLGDVFQVFYVQLQFYSPFPKAVTIERKQNYTSDWTTWQYYADDCQKYFQQPNNGPLVTPTSVNCLQFVESEVPYSDGQITFNILSPEPVTRPAYNKFYETPELHDFVEASLVRVKLEDHYFTNHFRHEYFGMSELTVDGRCHCNGHAFNCDTSSMPYKCNCTADSHTEGNKCERCQPLYNDKIYRKGDQINSYDCKSCECHGHADSCVYDVDLDLFPNSHDLGGGGVCQGCQHHTTGQFCETCVTYYYRPKGKSKYDVDVCSKCNCLVAGVEASNLDCAKVDGQCYCKVYVEGRQCDTCKAGHFNLQPSNPEGCDNCSCVTMGTKNGDITCHPFTGVCNCKDNVRNDKCDSCKYGYYNLTDEEPRGCTPCDCNPMGTTSQFCDTSSGQCPCKDKVVGRQCDVCAEGYYDFHNGCVPCKCDVQGSIPGTVCDPVSGQCVCKSNVQGLTCNECSSGSFGFGASKTNGCFDCTCELAGTINSSLICDKTNGNCVCKDNVEGMSCNQCKSNTFGLNITNPEGCQPCNCDASGTENGDTITPHDLSCDQNTGQCTCLSNRFGRACDDCVQDYYINPVAGGGCNPCGCDREGTIPKTHCHSQTGQCFCKQMGQGVTGRACNECLEKFYSFSKRYGNCTRCDCYEPGSKSELCDPVSGQCPCKDFVTNKKCDTCMTGTSHLDENNPYGCSKEPAQQPPPLHNQLSNTALHLYWTEPDYPNGVIGRYRLFRNGTLVFTGNETEMEFNDTGLVPYTRYTYIVEATNDFGSVNSPAVTFQTLPGTPAGIVIITVSSVTSNTAYLSWNQPVKLNGPLSNYSIESVTPSNPNGTVHWTGMSTSNTVSGLVPFTNYTVFVVTCTPGGCLEGWRTSFFTKSAPPSGMDVPVIDIVSYSELNISWVPPQFPNGIIIFYELWMRGEKKTDESYDPPATRIFHPGGQYNPRPTLSPQENALPPPDTNFIMSGLEPYTLYEFQVLAENDNGKTASSWISSRTGEAIPVLMPTPTVEPSSSTAVIVNWTEPSDAEARGIIKSYTVYFFEPTNEVVDPFAPPYVWKELVVMAPPVVSHTLNGLVPFTNYTFKIGACNSVGCINSSDSYGSTLQAIPEDFAKPKITSVSSTVIRVDWSPPLVLNGPPPVYSVQKTETSLSFPPNVIQGTRFPGGGYYLFPPDTIPINVGFTGIRFWFRTSLRDGLLMFAGSLGNQDEFIAVQFKAGRPWFLFDPQGCTSYVEIDPLTDDDRRYNDDEWHHLFVMRDNEYSRIGIDNKFQGCASFVTTTNDEGLPYNDLQWHLLVARREEKTASISIDIHWTGLRESTCATGTIIGPTSGVYIGGMPKNFLQRVGGADSRTQVIEKSFQGCVKDVEILQQLYPVEVWKPLDWTTAESFELAFANWQGCPTNLDSGIHFMGQGFLTMMSSTLQVRDIIEIQITFRTDMRTGLLFFAYGGPGMYFYLGLINGALHLQFSNNIATGSVTFHRQDISLCDGYWHSASAKKTNQKAEIKINSLSVSNGDDNFPLQVQTISEVYVGGLKPGSEAVQFVKDNGITLPFEGYGGCMKNVRMRVFYPVPYIIYVQFANQAVEISNVNLDGCTPFYIPYRTCRQDFVEYIYNGTEATFDDKHLVPYSDYLYRVLANNEAGFGASPWSYGRTLEGAPIGVSTPFDVVVVTGYIITAKWTVPQSISGLLSKYVLRAYNLDYLDIPPVQAEYGDKIFAGQINNATPHTNYSIKIAACTGGGCTESTDGVVVFTNQEAPEDVPAPKAISDTDELAVMWEEPGKPNGIITGYFLYKDGSLIYTGGEKIFNITGLQVYTSYQVYVRACTGVGCTNGPVAALSTAQLPPSFVKAPQLTALGTQKVEVRWEEPDQLNGVLQRYILYASTFPITLGHVVYNNSDFFTDYVIQELIAGTVYYITLSACTGGGCTLSSVSTIKTEESAPEGVNDPRITSPDFSELIVTWKEPLLPNGHITSYFLYHNEVLIYQGILMTKTISNLEPFSLHTFRLVACTVKGCGSSRLVSSRTLEAPPSGFVVMEAKVHDSRTIIVKWTPPDTPNGLLYYDIYLDGLFYIDPDNWDYRTVDDIRSVYNNTIFNVWVLLTRVIPMSSYKLQVNASNTAGFIVSNIAQVDMPEGTPDGVQPPNLVSQSSSSITATWTSVGRQNAKDAPVYVLQFRNRNNSTLIYDVFGPTTSYIYTKQQLKPYKEYDFRIKATNSHGSTYSSWVMLVTLQDKPIGLDPPMVIQIGSRFVNLTWQAPLTSNGFISEYKIYINDIFTQTADIDTMPLKVVSLTPFTLYNFAVEACTTGGCTKSSQSSAIRTRSDLPEEMSPPSLTSLTPTSVLITWSKPAKPNGLIDEYILERRSSETHSNPVVISQVLPSTDMSFVDESVELTPFTTYQYRVMVRNVAGATASQWSTVTTLSAKPSGLLPPAVEIKGPTSLEVIWQPPGRPNGILEYYVVRLPIPYVEIRNISILTLTFEDLLPYTMYSITLTACTDAGCTESSVVNVRTDPMVPEEQGPPLAIEISQTIISVAWQAPTRGNGPNVRFELSRMKLRQPLEEDSSNFNIWQSVYLGTQTLFEDTGLPIFTTFIYRVTVYNDVGQLTSNNSREVTTYGGFPRKAPGVVVTPVDHTTIHVRWNTPGVVDLQGSVKEFTVIAYSNLGNITKHYDAMKNHTLLENLTPMTQYTVYVTITIHGGASITSEPQSAVTLDGAPEGVAPPSVAVVSETVIRVSWVAPLKPNGQIIGYFIHVINHKIPTDMTVPGSYLVTNLLPYTVYSIKIEVCTVFDCTESEPVLVTTVEALPQGVHPPTLTPLSPTEIDVAWKLPENGNGIILKYDLIRQTMKPCSIIPPSTLSPEITKCTYVQCSNFENICGTQCFTGPKVCCDGVLHNIEPDYACCGNQYIPKATPDAVCCSGVFYDRKDNYRCCKDRYIEVQPGEVCCPDLYENRLLVGHGDTCCGSIPYSSVGSQVCCHEKLYDGFSKKCCGGTLVDHTNVCCGDDQHGTSYPYSDGHHCCGIDYINNDTSLCCTSDTGHQKIHSYPDEDSKDNANEKCCGLEKISKTLSCCNNRGYNPQTHVCADISEKEDGCGEGNTCTLDQLETAYCGKCDFQKSTEKCGTVTGYHGDFVFPPTPNPTDNCVVDNQKIYSGMDLKFTDNALQPFSMYQYAVSVVNSAGETTSQFTPIVTEEAPPDQVLPPVVKTDSSQLYVVDLSWDIPLKPNGDIVRFILTRDGVELYRGMTQHYKDDAAILPYQSFTYVLTACTTAGCTASPQVTIATAQSKPEGVHPPTVTDVTSTVIKVKWTPPLKLNGIIKGYTLHVFSNGTVSSYQTTTLTKSLTELVPYEKYGFVLEACTYGGCTSSSKVIFKTLADLPEGVHPPKAVILTSTSVQLFWDPPRHPNGEILFYAIMRLWSQGLIYLFMGFQLRTIDKNLTPGQTYKYHLITGTNAGNMSSIPLTVTMPVMSLPYSASPKNVTVLSSSEIYVEWYLIDFTGGTIDQYGVLLNAGQDNEINKGVGTDLNTTITGLKPYTKYEVRIKGCVKGFSNRCGLGDPVIVRTFESLPYGLNAPIVLAEGPNAISVSWDPPINANGIIIHYMIYYRQLGASNELLINSVSNDVTKIQHVGNDLKPYTQYEYKVVASNSIGDVSSPWAINRTFESSPKNLLQPSINSNGPFGFEITWQPPQDPNGVITLYKIFYRLIVSDPSIVSTIKSVTVQPHILSTYVSGLEPFSNYEVKLTVFNRVGNISAVPAVIQTQQSSPSGMPQFTVEKIDTGTSVILRWNPPTIPNGIITKYVIYEGESVVSLYQGLNREYEFRRLLPFSEYFVKLEACTIAGCSIGNRQSIITAEISPSDQPNPSFGFTNSTLVVVTWAKPVNPNGNIIMYEVLRQSKIGRKRSFSDPIVIHKTMDTDKDTYLFTDTGLLPFTEYLYSIKASNSKGSVQSSWQSVFTTQAAPEGVHPPSVTHVSDDVHSLFIQWTIPDYPNGIIQSYNLQRNETVPLTFTANDPMEFTDINLVAYTWYSYIITVCTAGGCSASKPTLIRTHETSPVQVASPSISVLSSTALNISWIVPSVSNGIIINYILFMDNSEVYSGAMLSYVKNNLIPYHEYSFYLRACTSGGCTDSGEVKGRPNDDVPMEMPLPILNVLSSRSIEVTWQAPIYPNGIIHSYDVRRDGKLVYTESLSGSGILKTSFIDYELTPGTIYEYVVIARNNKGSVESSKVKAKTYSASPSGLAPPDLQPLTSTSVQATWQPPTFPNGAIVNYTLYQASKLIYSGGPTIFTYLIPGLEFWTEYSFRIGACTDRGCELSTASLVKTLESRPEEQSTPTVLALADVNGAHAGVQISWTSPLKPNGNILYYELFRRLITHEEIGISYSGLTLIYNGTKLQHTDTDNRVKPYKEYQYMVISGNKAGKAESFWQTILTKEAPPEFMLPPSVDSKTSSTITVTLSEPAVKNGIIRKYSVIVNNTVVSSSTTLYHTIGQIVSLKPYTVYALQCGACTAGGCTTSEVVTVQTSSSIPTGMSPITVVGTGSTIIQLKWNYPTSPNGQIIRFILYQRKACPLLAQPLTDLHCNIGEVKTIFSGLAIEREITNLSPYTAYEFQIHVENDAGFADGIEWIRAETKSSDPLYVAYPRFNGTATDLIIDWSNSFTLNGRLQEYILVGDSREMFRGIITSYRLKDLPLDRKTEFVITLITDYGSVESPVIVYDPSNIGSTDSVTISMLQQEVTFYNEVWFIVLVSLIGALLVFTLLACCLRQMGANRPYIRERSPLQLSKSPETFNPDEDSSYSESASSGKQFNTISSIDLYGQRKDGITNYSFESGYHEDESSKGRLSDLFKDLDEDKTFWEEYPHNGLFLYDEDSDDSELPGFNFGETVL